MPISLSIVSSWALVALGVAHIAYGLVRYRVPLRQAVAAGFVGRFDAPDLRRAAFWFVMFGVPLLLVGHLAVRAAGRGDLALLGLVGDYLLAASVIGTAAFPRSPFPLSLLVAVLLMLAGQGA